MSFFRPDQSFEKLSESCHLLQHSHWAVSRNKLDLARDHALAACNILNEQLGTPCGSRRALVRELAQFALSYYKNLTEKGVNALSAQERFCWLTSAAAVTGGNWFPILHFGEYSSIHIAPFKVSDDSITLPDFGPTNSIAFRDIESLLDVSMDRLSIASKPQNEDQAAGDLSDSHELHDLYQDVLSDCSFVSSLVSISELGLSKNLRSLVNTFDNRTAKGLLLKDGCWREVGISRMLPFFETDQDRYMFVRSLSNMSLEWPALLEKAYICSFQKHYDFDGSNMANDTYMLTGWLPEICLLDQASQNKFSEFWQLKLSGDLMIGLGTGQISPSRETSLGIIGEHDYVLSQYDESTESCTLTNPWAFRCDEDKRSTRKLRLDRSMTRHFKYLYLNWRPQHENETKIYFVNRPSTWPMDFLRDKPQFHLQNKTSSKSKVTIFVEKLSEGKADFCVSVWRDARYIINTSRQFHCIGGGKFVNSRHQLMRLDLEPNQDHILSVVAREEVVSKFAITVYHDEDLVEFKRAKSGHSQVLPTISGVWGGKTAGGNWSNESYINNPQYDLEIQSNTRAEMTIGCSNPDVDLNLHLIHCNHEDRGRKLRKLEHSRLVFSEKYTKGLFHHAIEHLEPGCYKLLASTYNRGDSASYNLLFAHDGDETIKLSPTPDALGTFQKDASFEWESSNRKMLEIRTSHNNTTITCHLRSGADDVQQAKNYRPAIRASVFDGLTKKPVVLAHEWNDSVYGIFVDCRLPDSDRFYILLVERFETGDGLLRLSVGSSHRVEIQNLIQP